MDQPALRSCIQVSSIENKDGKIINDEIELSSNAEKVTTTGKKQDWRITHNIRWKIRRGLCHSLGRRSTRRRRNLHVPSNPYIYQ